MAIRPQFFEGWIATPLWDGKWSFTIPAGAVVYVMSRFPYDGWPSYSGIFTDYRGGLGRIQFTKATEFIVIEHIASSPETLPSDVEVPIIVNPGGLQIKINTTFYFLNPDGSATAGVPGIAAPYPRSTSYQDAFSLDPPVYVLPGQNWELVYTVDGQISGGLFSRTCVLVACKYTVYDGRDAVVANKLLEMGISVTASNADWYKRQLMSN